MILHEPDVALTDFLLSAECFLFSVYLLRRSSGRLGGFLFSALCLSSFLGAVFHGFFPYKEATPLGFAVWILVLSSIGLTAVSIWFLVFHLLKSPPWTRLLVLGGFVGYLLYALFIDHSFRTAIFFYLPPLVVFLLVLVFQGKKENLLGILGCLLTLGAAVVQQEHLGLPQFHLNHNAIYHLIQAVALALLFLALKRIA